MPDRRYTYTVEIDAAQARQAATQLRAMFERELAQIKTGATTGTNGTGSPAQSALRAAELQLRADLTQTTARIKAEEAIRVNVARGESQARIALAKGEARAIAEAAEAATTQIRGEENRRTAILKSELKEREAAARASAKAQSSAAQSATSAGGAAGGMGKLPFGMTVGSLAGGAAAALGIYGVDQVARATFDAGKEGAMQMRQAETFEALAQRVGVSSAAIIRSIREASRETITSTNAMGLGAQVLSQKFAASSDDIGGDIETLVKFARRASQIYTDESGAFLSTQDVFSRLIKFSREGNKELVDQFGLSNQLIAEAAGTTVQGLASAGGAADRWRGLIALLGDETERLGEATLSVADKFEADIARMDESWNRVKRNLAEPVSIVVEGVANTTEAFMIGSGQADADMVRGESARQIANPQLIEGQKENLEKLLATFEQLDAATAKNGRGVSIYRNELIALGQDILNSSSATAEQLAQMERLGRTFDLIAAGQDAWSYAMQVTTQKGIESNATLFQMAAGMGRMQNAYEDGTITLDQYVAAQEQLASAMRTASEAAGVLTTGMNEAANEVEKITPLAEGARDTLMRLAAQMAAGLSLDAIVNVRTAYGDPNLENVLERAGGQLNIPGVYSGSRSVFSGTPTGEIIRSLAGAETGLLGMNEGIRAQNDKELQDVYTIREDRRRADEQAAQKAASAFESAAKKAQSAFEAAAQKTANEFKSALEAVPGLFGTSEVTAEDMALAKLGGYQNKADERLRVLADEVLNKKDTPEDAGDWARRMGLDPGTDPKRVLAEAQARWADSSLFAGGANLDLLNRDAITASLARGDASKAGKDALLKEFGLGAGSPLDEAGQSALKEMLGLGEEELTGAGSEARQAFDAGFYAPAAKGAGNAEAADGQGMASTLAAQLKTDIEAGEVADALYSLGGSIIGRIHAGYEAAAKTADWSSAVIESLAAEVAPIVIEQIADQLPPKP